MILQGPLARDRKNKSNVEKACRNERFVLTEGLHILSDQSDTVVTFHENTCFPRSKDFRMLGQPRRPRRNRVELCERFVYIVAHAISLSSDYPQWRVAAQRWCDTQSPRRGLCETKMKLRSHKVLETTVFPRRVCRDASHRVFGKMSRLSSSLGAIDLLRARAVETKCLRARAGQTSNVMADGGRRFLENG